MRYSIVILLCAVCLVACGNRRGKSKTQSKKPEMETPAVYGYKIVNSYPHDPGAYTQGLFLHDGRLWESTGEYGRSTLRAVDLETGEVMREAALPENYFAEGAVIFNGSIYQLTWLEERCFVYDAATLERTGEFVYGGEGWGLATDGVKLYMSDGTPNITVRDPATFRTERTVAVRNAGKPILNINELEWVNGRIWANVYLTEGIIMINPDTGSVEGTIDFSGITSQLEITPSTDVMNGIAYDADTGRIFITGKNWNRLFEVEIFKK